MTGEMSQGEVTRDNFPGLFQLMDGLQRLGIKSKPRAFDQYQGPYLAVRNDLRSGRGVYAPLVSLPGAVRVWYSGDGEGGFLIEHVTDSTTEFEEVDTDKAVERLVEVLG